MTETIRTAMARLANRRRPDSWVLRPFKHAYRRLSLYRWEHDGCCAPPPHLYKQRTVLEYARRYGCNSMVETGTFEGEMLAAMRLHFDQLISIEIDPALHNRAEHRFRRHKNIRVLLGDSAEVLMSVLPDIECRCLFWLDAHYSGGDTGIGVKETPIWEELALILARTFNDVLLIDDARCFDGTHAYPTISSLRRHIAELRPTCRFEVINDIIRVTPEPQPAH